MNESKTNWALFFLAVAVTIFLFPARGTGDVSSWLSWMNNALDHGIVGGYTVTHDNYPPLTIIILWCVGKIAALGGIGQAAALKISQIAFLGATSLCVWHWTRSVRLALLVYLIFSLNALGLGYTDIYFAPSLVLCLWALQQRRWAAFSILFAVTALIKYQMLIFAPFLAAYIFSEARGLKSFRVLAAGFLPAFALAVLCLVVFGTEFPRTFKVALHHTMFSANALNLNWLLTWGLHVGLPDQYGALNDGRCIYLTSYDPWVLLPAKVLFYGFYGAAFVTFARGNKDFVRTISFTVAGFVAYFLFNVGVHENHLFIAALALLILSHFAPQWRRPALFLCAIFLVNGLVFYGLDGQGIAGARVIGGIDITLPLAFLATCQMLTVFASVVVPVLSTRQIQVVPPMIRTGWRKGLGLRRLR